MGRDKPVSVWLETEVPPEWQVTAANGDADRAFARALRDDLRLQEEGIRLLAAVDLSAARSPAGAKLEIAFARFIAFGAGELPDIVAELAPPLAQARRRGRHDPVEAQRQVLDWLQSGAAAMMVLARIADEDAVGDKAFWVVADSIEGLVRCAVAQVNLNRHSGFGDLDSRPQVDPLRGVDS